MQYYDPISSPSREKKLVKVSLSLWSSWFWNYSQSGVVQDTTRTRKFYLKSTRTQQNKKSFHNLTQNCYTSTRNRSEFEVFISKSELKKESIRILIQLWKSSLSTTISLILILSLLYKNENIYTHSYGKCSIHLLLFAKIGTKGSPNYRTFFAYFLIFRIYQQI